MAPFLYIICSFLEEYWKILAFQFIFFQYEELAFTYVPQLL